jgi:hypothetical protein
VGGAWALAEVAKKRFTDGHRTLRRWALTSWRGHAARVPHFRQEDARRRPRQASAYLSEMHAPPARRRAAGSEANDAWVAAVPKRLVARGCGACSAVSSEYRR